MLLIITWKLIEGYLIDALNFVVSFAPKLVMAGLVLWLGLKLVNKALQLFKLTLEKSGLDQAVRGFAMSFAEVAMKIAVVLLAASFIGFEMTSILGLLAAASFAVAFALQGSLSNFASGLLIMIFKPYKIGDIVEVNGKFGKVEAIGIFSTILSTPGLKTLIIPNGKISEDTIINFSARGAIRLELSITMPYEESFPKVRDLILETLTHIPVVLQDPKPEVGIELFDTHNILLTVRPCVLPDDYWEGTFETHRLLKAAFSKNKIQVAYSEGIELGPVGQ